MLLFLLYSTGHQPGRPVFGSRYCGSGENLLITWGVDGRLCLWDSLSYGNIHSPIATLVANGDYPIYAVDIQESVVALGGGGAGEISFLGVSALLYDIKKKATITTDARNTPSAKPDSTVPTLGPSKGAAASSPN